MVRIEREEELYDRDEVLGRDATSVFPSQAKSQATGGGGVDADAIRDMLGGRKFVTESELATIKAQRGESADDGTAAPLKPLAEVLREAKEAKQAAFDDKWKQMKTGKNRPLDDEEMQFLESLAQQESAAYRAQKEHEKAELEEFRRAMAEAAAKKEAEAAAAEAKPSTSAKPEPKKAMPAIKSVIKPVIKAVKKDTVSSIPGSVQHNASIATAEVSKGREAPDSSDQPAAKKAKAAGTDDAGSEGEGGLAGLLGGYGSDSD